MSKRLVVLLALFAAVSAVAQTTSDNPLPTSDRGFKPEQVYQFNGFDSVNLFNGNLNLTIPLATYPVSSDVSYSFVLRFSGNVFQHWYDCPPPSIIDPDPPPCILKWHSQVGTAGLGWQLGFGGLATAHSLYYEQNPTGGTFKYITPDGAEHLFYETLHEPKCPSSTDCDQIHPDVWYTRDGSYLRLKEFDGYKVIEFPDGQRHRFSQHGSTGAFWYRLDYIYGASSQLGTDNVPVTNFVRFEYPSNGTQYGQNWKITDSHGREHWVYFRTDDNYGIERLTLTAPKRPSDPAGTIPYAEYKLFYNTFYDETTTQPRVTIPWPCDVNNQGSEAINFLTRIELPGGDKWKFDYNRTECSAAGTLTKAVLPTGGRLRWTYQSYHSTQDHVGEAQGVKQRCMRTDDSDCSDTDTTSAQVQYMTYKQVSGGTEVETYARKSSGGWGRDVRTMNYFAAIGGAYAALPFTLSVTDGHGRYLSSETWDCNPDTNACSTLERRQFVKYEMDDAGACNVDYPCYRDRNRRVQSERTEYSSDGGRYADATHSDFDGLGHYRKTVTAGNFASGNVKETYTGYNLTTRLYNPYAGTGQDVGIYALTSNGKRAPGYRGLEYSDSWMLNTFTEARTREYGTATGTVTSYSEACFDPMTGFLKARRSMRTDNDGWPDPNDVVTIYIRDAASGYPSRQETFGGDKQTVSTDSLCTFAPPAHNQYSSRIDHTYQYGVLKTSQFSGMPWYSVNNSVIDKWTGLVLESRDVSDQPTTYIYDRSRRVTSITPPGVLATTYTYNPISGTNAQASVQAKAGSGDQSIEQTWVFDPFGRVSLEKKLMPNNTWSVVKTTYDSLGHRASVSEAETETGADYTKKTEYANYDPFGRVGTITAPDGKTTTLTYAGDRLTTRSYTVAKENGDANVSVREERDRAGRLIKLTEDVGGTSQVTTDYTYDEANRLATVKIWNGSTPQTRSFDYDGRGFLTSETHPESGTTTYQYDARGLVIDKNTPVASLVHVYDAAGRLKSVSQSGVGLLKVFNYDRANDFWTGDYSMGKADDATRYNRSTELGTVTVREQYFYSGVGGRLSQKNTIVTRPNGESSTFYENYAYNSLGDPSSVQYPLCSSGACLSLAAPSRSVTTTYKHGLITAIPNYTTSTNGITYYPNGAVDTITHRNVNGSAGPTQKFTIANRMARVDSITVSNFCDSSNLSVNRPQPQPHSVPNGSQAGLSVNAPGATSYQWYRVLSNGTQQLLSGQTGSTLTATVTETSTYFVRVGNGSCTLDSERATVTVSACTPPDATITAPATARASDLIYASVPATTGATYSWSVTGGVITGGQGTRQISIGVGCSGTVSISVTVSANGCSSNGSRSVQINAPTVSVTGTPTTITQGNSATITATFEGLTPWTVTWSDTGQTNTVSGTSISRNVTPGQTTTYSVTAADSNGCPATVLSSVTITVAPPAPSGVVATATAATQVRVTWSFGGSADSFNIYRGGIHVGTRTMPASYEFIDATALANTAYVYTVVAVKSGVSSSSSTGDLATTVMFTDDPLTAGTFAKAVHLTQLHTAVNAVRQTAGLSPYSFTSVAPGAIITAARLEEIRSALDPARSNLVLPAAVYTRRPVTAGMVIMARDIIDTRDGVK